MDTTPIYHQDQSIATVCRLCFMERKPHDLEPIFDSDDGSGHLSKWIEKLTSLKIINIPNSPVSLCSNCKHTLEAFDSFREMCLTNDIVFKETFCRNEVQERELTDVSIKVEFGEEQLAFEQGDDVPSTKPSIDINQAKFQYVGIHDQDQENQNEQNKQDNQTAEETDSSEDDYEMQTMENALLIDSGVQSNETNSIANETKRDRKTVPLYEGRFMCNVCEKQVTKLHHSTHKGQQLFECYICKNTFRKFANLSRHIHNHIRKEKYHHKDSTMGNHHQEAGPSSSNQEAVRNGADILMDRDYECKMCNKTVSSLHALNHKPEGFRCPICESLFQRFDCFGRHVRCHKSKGKYACDICSMRFPSTYRMGRHRRLHFGNKS